MDKQDLTVKETMQHPWQFFVSISLVAQCYHMSPSGIEIYN